MASITWQPRKARAVPGSECYLYTQKCHTTLKGFTYQQVCSLFAEEH